MYVFRLAGSIPMISKCILFFIFIHIVWISSIQWFIVHCKVMLYVQFHVNSDDYIISKHRRERILISEWITQIFMIEIASHTSHNNKWILILSYQVQTRSTVYQLTIGNKCFSIVVTQYKSSDWYECISALNWFRSQWWNSTLHSKNRSAFPYYRVTWVYLQSTFPSLTSIELFSNHTKI